MASKAPIAASPPDLPDELVAGSPPVSLARAELEAVLWERLELADADARLMRLVESRLVDVDLTGASLAQATFRDVLVTEGSWANVKAPGLALTRVAFERSRLTGADFSDGVLDDVTFVDCRLDLSSFQNAKLSSVRFQGCRVEEGDFHGAALTSCVFEDCVLVRSNWSGAVFTRSEMRGVDLAGAGSPERLRGVRMPFADVVNAAAELAHAVGIEIVD